MRAEITDEIQEDEVVITIKKKPKTEVKTDKRELKTAGRKKIGKSLSNNKITFYVDDEQLEYMESLTNKKGRTPNAIAKKIFLIDYELNKDKVS